MSLPVRRAHELEEDTEATRWLIEGLWSDQAVGIVGGEPKCCKSHLALSMAVAVASGRPCMGRFSVSEPGRVLLYPAEDPLRVVRRRLEGIAAASGVKLSALDLHVITAPSLRLDIQTDRERLTETIVRLQPKLLILDPFVRLHRVDENVAAEVVPILAYLRHLQRQHKTAVVLVHHARKGAGRARGGQALRGSSELHAIGDSNLYLRRTGERLLLDIEHRAAASVEGITIELSGEAETLALRTVDSAATTSIAPQSVFDKILAALASAQTPMSSREIRAACKARMNDVSAALSEMIKQGRLVHNNGGYRLRLSPTNQLPLPLSSKA